MRQDHDGNNLPESVRRFVDEAIRGVSWRRSVRGEVRLELLAHFEDALRQYEKPEDRELRGRQMVEDFGDLRVLRPLIRRGKSRCRPLWEKMLVASGKAAAVLVVLLIAGHVAVDRILLRSLAEQAESIRAMGRPVSLEDLHLPEWTPEDNAEVFYAKAMTLAREGGFWDGNLLHKYLDAARPPCNPMKDQPTISSSEMEEVGRILGEMGEIFSLLEEARACGRCIFDETKAHLDFGGVKNTQDTRAIQLPALARMRELTRYAAIRGLWESRQGNSGVALELFTLGLHVANDLENYPFLMGALTRISCVESVLNTVQSALYESEGPAMVSPEFWRELDKCLNPGNVLRAFDQERVYGHEQVSQTGLLGWGIMRPFHALNLLKSREILLRLTGDVQRLDVAGQRAETEAVRNWTERASRLYLVAKITAPAYLRVLESHTRFFARAALCDAAMALKAHRRDNGAYPDSLAALKGRSSRGLPLDPYTGEPFLYRREGDGFILYSVGADLKDGGGIPESDIVWCAAR